MTTVKSIPTVYNGTRYRSKLEADWARFFDHAGISKVYEPEGRYVGKAQDLFVLCDFLLPGHGWFEVKGHWTQSELEKFTEFAIWAEKEQGRGCIAGGPDGVLGLVVPEHPLENSRLVPISIGYCSNCGEQQFALGLALQHGVFKCRKGCRADLWPRLQVGSHWQAWPAEAAWQSDPEIGVIETFPPWFEWTHEVNV